MCPAFLPDFILIWISLAHFHKYLRYKISWKSVQGERRWYMLWYMILYDIFVNCKLRQWPTWYTLALFYNTSTTIPYTFRALHAHHQEAKLYRCSIWYRPLSQLPSGTQIDLCSGRPLTEDDTRYCINTVKPPDDEHVMIETCRGL